MKRSFFRKILFFLSVPKCICCKQKLSIDETVYCSACMNLFRENIDRNCSFCTKNLSECSCTPEYLSNHFVKKLSKVFRYTGKKENTVLSSLIYSLKENARFDTVEFAAELLCNSILKTQKLEENTIVTNVPRRRSAILKYGHDHSALVAKAVARKFGLKYKLLLKSASKTEQKHLTREERRANIKVKPRKNFDLSDKSVLIIDGVITSGASMAFCASVLRSLGCRNISSAAIAIAYRDCI